jgi:hypothetical protein
VDAVHSSGLNTVQKHSERTSADGFLSTSHVGNAGSTPAEIAQTFLYIADKSTVLWGSARIPYYMSGRSCVPGSC